MKRVVADLSFAGCGFLGMFHIGSLSAFRKYDGNSFHDKVKLQIAGILVKFNRCLGASSGSLIALAAVADLEIDWIFERFRKTIASLEHSKFGAFDFSFDVGRILQATTRLC